MAKRSTMSWYDLRVGVFVLVGIALIVFAIFYVTGAGLLGSKYHLITYVPEAEGLAIGAPVTLDGVGVGNVEKIDIAMTPPGQQPAENRAVEVEMTINRNFQMYIRADSTASLITQGFLGDREVTMHRGYTGRVLQNGEEVPNKEAKGLEQIEANAADLMQNFNSLAEKIGMIVDGVQKGQGTVGKLLVDQALYNHLDDTVAHVDQLVNSVRQGQGTIGKLVTDDSVYNRVNSITGRVDGVLEAVQDQKGTLGKVIYTPELHDSIKQFLDNTNGLISGVRSGQGTLGKLATDDSLFTAYRETGQNLNVLTTKLNSNQSSLGKLMTNPDLYDNLVGLTGDMRLLLGDFRKNPKKFLHVQFSIF